MERGDAAPELRPPADGRRGVHHAAAGRGREEEADRPRGEPATQSTPIAPYFLEEVRKELEGRYGAKQLYENGLTVQTALDLELQDVANRALDDGTPPGRSPARLPQAAAQRPRRAPHDRGVQAPALGSPVRRQRHRPGGRRRHGRVDHPAARRRLSSVTIDKKGFAWTRKTAPRSSCAAAISSKPSC